MTFIEDGNKDYTEKGLINYKKRMLQANVIRKIENFQKIPFFLEDHADLRFYFLFFIFFRKRLIEFTYIDIDELYDISIKLEPRNN
jgi:hypothetical protein